MPREVERARVKFAEQAWRDALSAFSVAASSSSLDADDLERMAVCAYLVGEDDECASAWQAAYRAASDRGDTAASARCAFWLGLCLMLRGQTAQAGGWLERAGRLVDAASLDCVTSGYLLIPQLLGAIHAGDGAAAVDLAVRATEIGTRFDDPDLRAFGTLGHGQALIASSDVPAGTARLDEVMVSVTAGEVGPITSGIVYCAVILECVQLFDLRRAAEWTDALSDWCDAQPDLVPYRGQCAVHRSQVQQAAGDWPDAITSAETARVQLADPPHPALGLACYQQAELHRLLGAFDEAEAAYRDASRHGHQPLPGLALLGLVRGDVEGAAHSIRRALAESGPAVERPALLSAAVDILRTARDLRGARAAAEELAELAARSTSEVLAALADQATGSILVAEGDPAAALDHLRRAATTWQTLHMPYEAARTAVLLGLACAALGDRISAALEFDRAHETFTELGAGPDLDRLAMLGVGRTDTDRAATVQSDPPALTDREREVLAHVASGETNREIAEELIISQHTVGRHLENIFAKLGVSTRAAATARAYELQLL